MTERIDKAAVTDEAAMAGAIKEAARDLGFDLVGIAPAVQPPGFGNLSDWLAQGFAGEMAYLPRRHEAYRHPEHVLKRVASVVMLGRNYRTEEPPPEKPGTGRISRYAWGQGDYHHVLREKLAHLADVVHELAPGCRTRGVVDTAPLLERDFARLAGLGWFGKNTMLLNKKAGSWLFLAALLTDLPLPADAPHETAHCGTCTRCLEVCPTEAFPEPYVLDARRCISYLTIELRDQPIPEPLRKGMGNWVFGCDLCQEVCPWNRKAPASAEPDFQPRRQFHPAELIEWFAMDAREFEAMIAGTPLERPGRAALLRNAAIVLGNSGGPDATGALVYGLSAEDALMRSAAAWGLGEIGTPDAITALRGRLEVEQDEAVRREIEGALEP